MEDLGRDGAHHRCQAVAEKTLGRDHQVQQPGARRVAQQDQGEVAEHEAEAADGPDPFAADAIGDVPQGDLAGDTDEADEPERPGRLAGAETDIDQVAGLVDLHGVPSVERTEIRCGDPPETAGPHRSGKGPVDGGPGRVDDVGGWGYAGRRQSRTVGFQAEILRPLSQQQIERHADSQQQEAQSTAGGAPAGLLDDGLRQWQ